MEFEATQQSTLPINHGAYSAGDYDDVICILQPASQSAVTVCHEIWRINPQFILQYSNAGLRADGTVQEEEDLEMIGGEDTQGPSATPRKTTEAIKVNDRIGRLAAPATPQIRPATLDIALRTSTPVRDILLGFTFGRDQMKSDIVLQTGCAGDARISGVHFRIYLNQYGMLMLEDTSTNGLSVDSEPLGKKYRNTTKTVVHGTVIDIVTNVHSETKDVEHAKFIVKLPNRNVTEYTENVRQYVLKIARRKQERQQELQQTHDRELFPKPGKVDIAGKLKGAPEVAPNMDLIIAGTKQYSPANGWTANGKYRVVSEIGKGAFAMVYKVVVNNGGEPRAAKRIDRTTFMKNGAMDGKFLNELTIMQKIDHPHVIHFHDYDLTSKHLFIVMEYMPCGDLAPYALKDGALDLSTVKSVTRQLLHALAYIHRNGIVHRDIKPENVLVQSKNPFFVKLSDFGLSKMIEKEDAAVFITFCGTLLYCAPEIYPDYEQVRAGLPRVKRKASASKPYSSAVDIWSLGTVIYHLLASKAPFKGTGEEQGYKMLRAVICDELNFTPLIAKGVDKNGIAFFNLMIDIDGELRPSAPELLNHPWMLDVPDITTIPNLEESQMIGDMLTERLESLREEDEWDKSQSESFIKAAGALVKTPTPDAPSLTTGETSADDKITTTDNDNSDSSSQVGSETTSQIPTTEMINQGSARWEDDSSIGSGQSGASGFKKPWPSYHGKDKVVEPSPSASEDETPKQARTNRLFGEISQHPSQESGIFGANMQPAFQSREPSPSLPSQNSPSLFGAESRMNNLNMKGSRAPKSILRSAVTNSMLNGKRYRSTNTSGSDESNTSSFDEPAAKKSMIRQNDLDSPEASFDAGLGKSIDFTKSLSQKVDDLQISTCLATLTPLPGCLSSTEVLLKTRLSTFGRAIGNTNGYEDPNDSRIPRSAFDIYFYAPGTTHIRNHAWHKEPNLYAIVMTRCSAGIKVNGTHVPPSTAGSAFKVAQLYTDDLIEVYNSGRNKLVYRCLFHVSESAYPRGADEPVIVEDNAELYQAANSGL